MNQIDGDFIITGALRVEGLLTAPINRTNLITEANTVFDLPLTGFRVWDAFQTNLPSIGAADDLGLAGGAFGTNVPFLKTQDLNAAGAVTEYARTSFILPENYVSGGTITLRLRAGMLTSVASVSGTVDAQAYLSARDTLVSGSDLVTTSAISANSLTFANCDFTITPTSRVAGDVLDIRIAWIGNSATASSHFGAIAHAQMLLQTKG